jgi:hypothetical protein
MEGTDVDVHVAEYNNAIKNVKILYCMLNGKWPLLRHEDVYTDYRQ